MSSSSINVSVCPFTGVAARGYAKEGFRGGIFFKKKKEIPKKEGKGGKEGILSNIMFYGQNEDISNKN